jgi:hypothetical protein
MQRIHSFKAGRQTASNGTVIDFTEADVAATAAAYNPALSEAPIVVGHPSTDAPAYGWIKRMTAQGPDLFSEPHQVNPEFAEMVRAGAFKKVSISLYPKDHPHNPVPGVYYPRHLGYLGATPPAIKGLKPTEFAEDAACLELELDFAEEPAAPATDPATPPANPATPPTPEPTTVTTEEARALKDRATQLEADLAAAHATLQAQAQAANTERHAAFAEGLIAEARIAPADKALLVATLDHMEPATLPGTQAQLVQFGEGTTAKPMADALRDFLKGLPKRVDFAEQASRERAAAVEGQANAVQYAEGTPPETIDLDKRIRAFASEHKLGYAEAAQTVAMQDARARR